MLGRNNASRDTSTFVRPYWINHAQYISVRSDPVQQTGEYLVCNYLKLELPEQRTAASRPLIWNHQYPKQSSELPESQMMDKNGILENYPWGSPLLLSSTKAVVIGDYLVIACHQFGLLGIPRHLDHLDITVQAIVILSSQGRQGSNRNLCHCMHHFTLSWANVGIQNCHMTHKEP